MDKDKHLPCRINVAQQPQQLPDLLPNYILGIANFYYQIWQECCRFKILEMIIRVGEKREESQEEFQAFDEDGRVGFKETQCDPFENEIES